MENSDYVLRDIIGQVSPDALLYPDADLVRQARITRLIEAKRTTLPNAAGVGLVDRNCVVTHTNAKAGVDASGREWCKSMREDPLRETFVSHVYTNKAGRLSVTQVRRFPDAGKGFQGSAGVALDLGFFSDRIALMALGPGGAILIADTRLGLLARKPARPELLGKTLDDAQTAQFVASSGAYASYRGRSTIDGITRLYGARKVDDLPFIVVVGEADSDWQASWRRRALGEMVALLLLCTMAILMLRKHWALLRHQQMLSKMANTDTLAGVANRRHFMSRFSVELKHAQRHGSGLAVLMLDIDHFKQINDTYGHAMGDQAILSCVQACQTVLRDIDFLSRFGGDEFAILLSDTGIDGAQVAAERLRQAILHCRIASNAGELVTMTVSIGLAMLDAGTQDVEAALAKADAALYRAKSRGRNCIEFAA
ncbi:diguanylate cyclase [Actimicrobium sp. CCI2.3]|uniref:sensor domain-containing diguanylate cyclase n=1 Tax=Actimicrobium sp. CCI2.3 TaxID=3048616 RepID=UPI002AB38514|nr:diguanylate cyclase [Actimicrobium sp. CCI2.3]MDY7576577.1 diguanylate cyclase [Actimicrobium sp. CCI2.3]MEB0021178.1 diguanylate cyclase [Actimicrobium sp. CCI2.3]